MNKIKTPYGREVVFPNLQENTRTVEVASTRTNARGPSDTTLVYGIQQRVVYQGKGIVTGMQLAEMTGYSNDPLVACAEWYEKFHSIVSGYQGDGNEYISTERDRTDTVAGQSVQTTRRLGQSFSIEYLFEIGVADSSLPKTDIEPIPETNPAPTTSEPATLDGIDLGTIIEQTDETSEEFEFKPIADPDASSGALAYREDDQNAAVREFTVAGRVSQNKNQFESELDARTSTGNTYTYKSAFPGKEYEVAIDPDFNTTRVPGVEDMTQYQITLVEGVEP